jgi:Tfp pilus assembly protein PilX
MTNQSKMTSQLYKDREHGVALLFCLFALLILTAVTASLILLAGTETSVNANYRTEEVAFFAAKTGIYEALDRMQQSNATSIAAQIPASTPSAAGGVLYIINAGSSLTVQPWNTANAYYDDELCHEGLTIGTWTPATSSKPPDVPCTTLPTGSTWYTTVNSNYPYSGTSTAMPYEWVRINWKMNSSQSYLSGGTTPTPSTYSVDSRLLPATASIPACWNGGSEVLLSTPSGVSPAYTSCEQYETCAPTSPSLSTPVL